MVEPSSGRATLLESIRQAGGIGKAKLRSVKERKLEKKKQKQQEQGGAGPTAGGALGPAVPRGLRAAPVAVLLPGPRAPSCSWGLLGGTFLSTPVGGRASATRTARAFLDSASCPGNGQGPGIFLGTETWLSPASLGL